MSRAIGPVGGALGHSDFVLKTIFRRDVTAHPALDDGRPQREAAFCPGKRTVESGKFFGLRFADQVWLILLSADINMNQRCLWKYR